MSLASTWIRLGGATPATEVAPHSPPTWETLAEAGNGESSFEFGRSAKFAPHLTQPDTLMEIFVGCMRVWLGRIGEYDRTNGQVVGRGIHTDGNYIPAFASGGGTTLDLANAVDTAIDPAGPWRWKVQRNGVTGTAAGSSSDPQMVWTLIQTIAKESGKRAYFDPDGKLFIESPATEPTWTITAEDAVFGPTSEDQSNYAVGMYDTGSGYAPVYSSTGGVVTKARIDDLTSKGTITLATAQAIQAALLKESSQFGWVNGVTLHREQITRNGTPAFLPGVNARNKVVRANGVPVTFGTMQATWLDTSLGKTRYTAGSDVIYVEPIHTAPRTVADVIAAA